MVFDEVVTLADKEEFAKQPIHRSRRRILEPLENQCKAVDGVCPVAKLCRRVCGETRLAISAIWAAAWQARLS
jgi:hypothetical protein